jgi:hypothetical protein
MKKNLYIALSTVVLATCFTSQVRAGSTSTARKELSQVYTALNAAAAQSNAQAVYSFNSSDFRCGIATNQLKTAKIHGRYGMLLTWHAAYENSQFLYIKTSIERLNLKNNRATVVIKDIATIVHKDSVAKATTREVMITRATETWVKRNKRWQLLRTYTLASKQLPSRTLT